MFNVFDAQSVELYEAEKRAGKTLCSVADTHEDLKRTQAKIKIYTNFTLKDPFFKDLAITPNDWAKISKNDLADYYTHKEEFKNCIFIIDELQIWFDSRNFMKVMKFKDKDGNEQKINFNQALGYFMGQMGKRGNVLRGTIHDYSQIDFRGRLYTDVLIYVFKGLVDEKGVWKQCQNNYAEFSKEEQSRMYIQKNVITKKLVKTNFLPEYTYEKSKPKYIKAMEYFDMYDTEEMI